MNEKFNGENKIESYEDFLDVKLTDVSLDELKKPERTLCLTFIVTPEFKIYVSKKWHAFIARNYGINLDTTLMEGYFDTEKDGTCKILFKPDSYQKNPTFLGTDAEYVLLKNGVENKLKNLLSS